MINEICSKKCEIELELCKRIHKSDQKTLDYGGMDIDFEVTTVQILRGITEIEKAWDWLQQNIGIRYCTYIYSDTEENLSLNYY